MAIPLTIKVFRGDTLVDTRRFEQDLIQIGKQSGHVDLLLTHADDVSRFHCAIQCDANGSVYVEDSGSAQGTFLNGQRIKRSPLAAGDEILLGRITLRVESPGLNH
ncbi:FHA domain-containing protein [Pyxidicoccus sp. 3LFB2]